MSGSARMSSGSLFHADGPVWEKARSPNLVRTKVPRNEWSREQKFHHGNECSRERIVWGTNIPAFFEVYRSYSLTCCSFAHFTQYIRTFHTQNSYAVATSAFYQWPCDPTKLYAVCCDIFHRQNYRRLASADPTVPTAPSMGLPIPNPNPKTHPNPNRIFNPNPNPFLKENKNDTGI